MPDWESIFTEEGKVFTEPHKDMPRIAQTFKDRGVQNILDVGCGTGRHLVFLSKLGFKMYGFDASPRALAMAREWLSEGGLEADLRLHRMEEAFPYSDGFFDAVIAVHVIHHNLVRDILKTIHEIERVLGPWGLIFISVPTDGSSRNGDWDLQMVEKGTYLPRKGREAGVLHHYFTEQEIYSMFSSFDILEMYIDDSGHRCCLGMKKRSRERQ
jgi:SAM-dependent methyltransferase